MTRSFRLLSAAAAPPPEAITLESDMVVILAALLCALICVVGMLAVARCACIRRRTATASPAAPRGLKKKVVQSLPKFTYAREGGACVSTECAICLAEFAEGEEIRVLPACRHGFHVGCVDTWLGSHSSCPSCRQTPVVAKCQKCGRFPAGAVADEGQLKAREDVPNLPNPSNVFLP